MPIAPTQPLLSPHDPPPVDVVNRDSGSEVLLVCEHAGRAIPEALGDLGVTRDVLDSHRGWDIGAEQVARGVAERLGATLIIQRYSRLVIDANRPPDSAAAVPEISDGAAIPGNRFLSADERRARVSEIFEPMDRELARSFKAAERRAAFSVHSFTQRMGGRERPWRAGFLSRASLATAEQLKATVARLAPGAPLAVNEPYQIENATDWFIPIHAEARGLPHSLIEIRNDQIDHPPGAAYWAELLAVAIDEFMETLR